MTIRLFVADFRFSDEFVVTDKVKTAFDTNGYIILRFEIHGEMSFCVCVPKDADIYNCMVVPVSSPLPGSHLLWEA